MDCEERVLAALNREEPDKVPTHIITVDGKICDQVLGKPPRTTFDVMDELSEQYSDDWVDRVNGILTNIEVSIFQRSAETAAQLGIDTVGAGYIPFIFKGKEEMIDVFGRKYKIVNTHGHIMPYYIDGMIKNRKDWENFPKPDKKDIFKQAKKLFRTVQRRTKDKDVYLMAQDDYVSVFPPVWQGMGMTAFSKALIKDPDLIQKRFDQATEIVIGLFETYAKLGVKIFFEASDMAFKSGPLINPKYIDKYVQPCMKRVCDKVHELGGKIIFHSDGDITSLMDFVVESGFDAVHCLEPPYVDLELLRNKYADKLCFLGNIDTSHILVDGTKQEVENAVKYAIKTLGPGGGLIISPTNTHPAMNLKQFKWMLEAVKKFGTYPINL